MRRVSDLLASLSICTTRRLAQATAPVLELLECRRLMAQDAGDTIGGYTYATYGSASRPLYTTPDPCPPGTEAPVRYADGMPIIGQQDLYSDGFGASWGHTRTWTDKNGLITGLNGNNWVVSEVPYLVKDDADTVVAYATGSQQLWFDLSSGVYTPRSYVQDTLAQGTGELILTNTDGTVTKYYDFGVGTATDLQGKFKSRTEAGGNQAIASYNGSNQLTEVLRSGVVSGYSVKESFSYAYYTTGSATGLLKSVTLQRKQWITGTTEPSYTAVRTAEYDYYGTSDTNGNDKDLKTVKIRDGSITGTVLDTTYYRYYTSNTSTGYKGGLKLVVTPRSYDRLAAYLSSGTPLTTADVNVQIFADHYFEYDSSHRATLEVAQGEGCTTCSAGMGTYKYAYSDNPNTDLYPTVTDYNVWRRKITEYLPDTTPSDWTDNDQNIVYVNEIGQPMLEIRKDVSSGDEWRTFTLYDSAGRTILVAQPSAVTGYNDTYDDLMHVVSGNYAYLSDSSGLLTEIAYGTSTTATAFTPGDVAGYYKSTKIKQGETATAISQEDVKYLSHAGSGATVYPIGQRTVYANDNGTGAQTTSYAYNWYSAGSGAQPRSVTTILPSVSSLTNGPGSSTLQTIYYDTYGQVIRTVDGDGYVDGAQHDLGTGSVTRAVIDGAYSAQVLSDNPVAWWRLGESSGTTAADASGNGHSGTYNSVTLGAAGALLSEKDTASTFNGSSSYVDIDRDAADLSQTDAVTVEAWVKPSSTGSVSSVFENTFESYSLLVDSTGVARFRAIFSDTSYVDLHGTTVLSTTAWQHLAVTYDHATVKLYVNGEVEDTAAKALNFATQTGNLQIGRRGSGLNDLYFPGAIDEVALYSDALAADRIQAHFIAGRSAYGSRVLAEAPLGYWRLGDQTGTTAYDASGNGINGTYTGSGYSLGSTGALSGESDRAVNFTGNSSTSINVTHQPALALTGDLTIVEWVKVSNRSGHYGVISKTSSNVPASFDFYIQQTTGTPVLLRGNGTVYASVTAMAAVPNDSNWHMVAVTMSGTTVTHYLDGAANGSSTLSTTIGDQGTDLKIANRNGGGTPMSGTVDEVALWSRALSSQSIKSLYDAGTGAQGLSQEQAITTAMEVDGLGRTKKLADPNGNVTHTVYKDATHEARVYRGWTGSTTTGPIEVYREYRPTANASAGQQTVYFETLTSSATPSAPSPDNVPDGTETIDQTNIQSLQRQLTNDAGQWIEVDDYFKTSTLTYSQATAKLGSSSNDSSSGNYHATAYEYGDGGVIKRTLDPTGTITRTVYDALRRPISQWIGIDDTGATNDDPDGSGGANNMKKVQEYQYDQHLLTQAAPAAPSLDVSTSGGSLPSRTYYVKITYTNSSGETLTSAEGSVTVPANKLLKVNSPSASTGMTGYHVYVSTLSGQETRQNGSAVSIGTAWTEPTTGLVSGVQPVAGGVGDGNLTQVTEFVNGAAHRTTRMYYDWRDRLVAAKSGDEGGTGESTSTNRLLTYQEYDNLNRVTATTLYDADGVTITSTSGIPNAPSTSARTARSEMAYDDLGQMYLSRQVGINQSNGNIGNNLDTYFWYDRRGNVIKTSQPGGLVNKAQYDGAGRLTKAFTSDGGSDPAAGATSNWESADDVSGDKVLEQVEYAYDLAGNVTLMTSKQRFHTESGTGELNSPATAPKARRSYVAYYYDSANRLTGEANVGTNAGSAYTRPSMLPTRSDTVLVTSYSYGSNGLVQDVTDPRAIVSRTSYDALGRVTQAVQAYTDGAPSAGDDQTTQYTYDGNDHILTAKAVLPSSAFQTTQYIYGVTTSSGSDIVSNNLLSEVRYPDKSTGSAGTASTDKQTFKYNALGQAKEMKDQNGTIHQFSFDLLGRVTEDYASTLGTSIDGTVRRHKTGYGPNGQASQVSSLDNAGTTTLNSISYSYNTMGQVSQQSIARNGATTRTISYAYNEGAGSNNSRLTKVTYPNGRYLHYGYSSGLDDSISRVSYLADDNASGAVGTHLEEYSYLGLGTIIERNRPQPGTKMTYYLSGGSTDAGDQYVGLDRFGRVIDQRWLTTSTSADLDRYKYGYDRDSNRLYKENTVSTANSELYHANSTTSGDNNSAYDKLGRLTGFRRGGLTSSTNNGSGLDTVSTSSRTQTWSLDALGNWDGSSGVVNDGTSQSRSHNKGNQLTVMAGNNLAYDSAGNQTTDERGWTFTYDAWGKLIQVKNASAVTQVTYSYDALGERITETIGSTTKERFYNTSWQMLEERTAGASTAITQFVWGPGYIDALVLTDRDADANGGTGALGQSPSTGATGLEQRLYAQQDANWNVTSLTASSGTIIERYIYDPYGAVTIMDSTWTARAGNTSSYGQLNLFQGGRLETASSLYTFRNRDYSTSQGRWTRQDPAGYVDGPNLYQAVLGQPISTIDPNGLDGFVQGFAVGLFGPGILPYLTPNPPPSVAAAASGTGYGVLGQGPMSSGVPQAFLDTALDGEIESSVAGLIDTAVIEPLWNSGTVGPLLSQLPPPVLGPQNGQTQAYRGGQLVGYGAEMAGSLAALFDSLPSLFRAVRGIARLGRGSAAAARAASAAGASAEEAAASGSVVARAGGAAERAAARSPTILPGEVAGRTPSEIDALATQRGLIPRGRDPMNGLGVYIDPVTGEQRVLCHSNARVPHAHVNDPSGARLDINGNPVAPHSPEAHLPIGTQR